MRLWHYKLLNGLPKNQLISQLRECVAISKSIYENGTPNHILVNKIMCYPMEDFIIYCNMVIKTMAYRGYKVSTQTIKKLETYIDFYLDSDIDDKQIFNNWHNVRYANQCFMNLQEKYDCNGMTYSEWFLFNESFRNYLVSELKEKNNVS